MSKFIISFFQIIFTLFCFLSASQASFDRVRIVIASSSDWTILSLKDSARIVNAKSTSLQGISTQSWSKDAISINQSLENALRGQSVQAQFDIILKSESPSLTFESTKGNLGIIKIYFYNYNNNEPKLVDIIENANSSGHPNPKIFSIDTFNFLEGNLGYERSDIRKMIFAFYYPWYTYESWRSPYLLDNPLNPYSSDNISAIQHHVYLAKQAGIDGFISSWWGPNDYTDKNLQKLLNVAEDMGFSVSIYFETLADDPPGPRSESEILSWLRYFIQTYGKDKRFFHFKEKPVIFIWAAGTLPIDVWERIFKNLRNDGYDAFFIADTINQNYLRIFDGLHTYGPTSGDETFKLLSDTTKSYGWLENDPRLKIWLATVQPGYDDTVLPGRRGLSKDRSNGATYINTFEASISTNPDWILISTFNEWWENTHIEPSQNYGTLYLELTAKYADIYKGFEPRPPTEFFVPTMSEPNGKVQLKWNKPFAQEPDSYNIYRNANPFSNISKPAPLATGVKNLFYTDLPPIDGKYYYGVSAVFGETESPLSKVFSSISSRNKAKADTSKEIPVDIAIYVDSTSWISETEARNQANNIIHEIGKKVNNVKIVSSNELPEWILTHTKNDQPDIIILFGDFPDSIYASGNQQPDDSLAEIFLDDGNIFFNTADYIFWGKGRNAEGGLMNMTDIKTTMWGDNTFVKVTELGKKYTTSLKDFFTDRPFHIDDLAGTDWEQEIIFADDGGKFADPIIVRNKKTGGRIGIILQTMKPTPQRYKVISEIILNWLPTVLTSSGDVNKDKKVDFNDLEIVKKSFGKIIDQVQIYNPDVNRDGIVNIIDLVLVAIQLFESIEKQ
ncbi:MAG: dockerin type I domain-containing protein [bacterium]